MVYQKLGELENAKKAFQCARELFMQYRVGISPHYDLAKILIDQGQFDEAIAICQELFDRNPHSNNPHSPIKILLQKTLDMKKKKAE